MAPEPPQNLEPDWKDFPKALVTVAKFTNTPEAHLAGGKLLSEGIWSVVADEYMSELYSAGNGFLGGIRLQVKASDLPKALEILGLSPQFCLSCGAATETGTPFCGQCGQKFSGI
jgi:hypothetical protein